MDSPKQQLLCFPVESIIVSKTLNTLCHFLETSIGVDGRVKLLVTSGSYLQISSTSSLIVGRVNIDCPLCYFLCHLMKNLPDFGLYYGVICSSFLKRMFSLTLSEKLSISKIINTLQKLQKYSIDLMNSPAIKFYIEPSVRKNLLPFVEKYLYNKPVVRLCLNSMNNLPLQIIKAFVQCLNDESKAQGQVFVQVEEGVEDSKIIRGIAYNCSDIDMCELRVKVNQIVASKIKILLFSIALTASKEQKKGMYDKELLDFFDEAIVSGVKLVACQKPVDFNIKIHLKRKGIIILERLGENIAHALEILSSATTIFNCTFLKCRDCKEFIGYLTGLEIIDFGSVPHLLLKNNEKCLTSLLISTRVIGEDKEEIQITLKRCIQSLFTIGKKSFILPGKGCFETMLYVKSYLDLNEEKNWNEVYFHFFESLLLGAGLKSSVMIDPLHYHAWSSDFQKTCNCGMFSKGKFRTISLKELQTFVQKSVSGNQITFYEDLNIQDCIYDCYETKINALCNVIESCINILDIGLIVKK